MDAIITDHAFERCKERCGWHRKAAQRMATLALNEGIGHKDTKGALKRYVDGIYLSERNANNVRIYGRHVFLFAGVTLITVLHLDHQHVRAVEDLSGRKKAQKAELKKA